MSVVEHQKNKNSTMNMLLKLYVKQPLLMYLSNMVSLHFHIFNAPAVTNRRLGM